MKIIVLVMINTLFCFLTRAAEEKKHELTLYLEWECQGEGKYYGDSERVIPKGVTKAKSVRIVGTWVFYQNKEFNGGSGKGAVEVHSSPTKELCIRLEFIAKNVESVQRVNSHRGDYFYSFPKISFWEEPAFKGKEWFKDAYYDRYNVTDDFSKVGSLILHGGREWSLFDKKDLKGNFFCLFPEASPYYKPRVIPLVSMITKYEIKSVKMGCDKDLKPLKHRYMGDYSNEFSY